MTDIFTVETADHARLQLQLSYNWQFEVDKGDEAEAERRRLLELSAENVAVEATGQAAAGLIAAPQKGD